MPYLVIPMSRQNHQVTIDEILAGITDLSVFNRTPTNYTRTCYLDYSSWTYLEKRDLYPVSYLISLLKDFNKKYEDLISCSDKAQLYNTFYIPKRSGSGKWRRIDAPCSELDTAIRALKYIFETQFNPLCHTSAHAYVSGRSNITAVKVHQKNQSRWFLKLDFKNFFGSITHEFAMKQLCKIVPWSYVCDSPEGFEALSNALSLCFLNGGLPQGTAISPMLTNLVMIPFDYHLSNTLRNEWSDKLISTRYADDITISCRVDFEHEAVVRHIREYLKNSGSPLSLNGEKTKYVSANGKNYILGVMYNKDLEITIGANRKRQLKAAVTSYLLDKKNGHPWSLEDVQILTGQISYYRAVERDTINAIIDKLSAKFNIDFWTETKADLSLQ